jgi:hypothetical protein
MAKKMQLVEQLQNDRDTGVVHAELGLQFGDEARTGDIFLVGLVPLGIGGMKPLQGYEAEHEIRAKPAFLRRLG